MTFPLQYKKFPPSRYMGSKNKIIKNIYNVFKDLKFNKVLDLFSGSSSVSYLLKCMGKTVISNDYMYFTSNISKAIIENNHITLAKKDLEKLLEKPKKYDRFVQKTFKDIFYDDTENDWIDIIRHNIKKIKNPYKKALAYASLVKACQKKQSRGIFTFKGKRYGDGRSDLKKTIQTQFIEAAEIFNNSIFNNKKTNKSFNLDFNKINQKADLIYIDPPYYSKFSDNEYVRRYHFVEGLVRDWKGVKIQEESKVKKFKKYPSAFDTKDDSYKAIESLINKYKNNIIVFSYSSNSLPTLSEIKKMGKNIDKKVNIKQVNYTYSFGTQEKEAKMENKVKEYLITIK